MRRKEREVLELDEIIKVIDRCEIVRLAMVDNGVPYIVPLNFGYELKDNVLILYFHSALQGRKIDVLKVNPSICFEMDCSYKTVKDEIPCNWSAEYESVIGYGNVSFIESAEERKAALDFIMKRYGFEGVLEYNERIFQRTSLCRIIVDTMTCKRNTRSS